MATPLVFNHIPKVAGTSLRLALTRALGASDVVVGFDRLVFGGFSDFQSMAAPVRNQVALVPEDLPPAPELVAGHYALSTTRARYPDARHLLVLREARSRLLSLWLFWRSLKDEHVEPLGSWAREVRKAASPLAAFLADRGLSAQLDNVSVRFLLWPHPAIPIDGPIDERDDERLLEEASARLATFDHVDIIENPGFAAALSAWLGATIAMERLNETGSVPTSLRTSLAAELTPAAMAEMARLTRLDEAVWRMVAARRLDARLLESIREASFAQSLARHSVLMTP